jgi:protein-L-isoaspartate(D-aspartate) O-methyltransferase
MNRIFTLIALLFVFSMTAQQDQKDEYEGSRQRMVLGQIKARGITNNYTIQAMSTVPRHLFVPSGLAGSAYNDSPLPIGYGQTISQPYIVAFMTQRIRPRKDFRVLEIGTGSGYQAAILGEIVDSVFTIEIVEELYKSSKKRLQKMNYGNVRVKFGDGYHGWPEKGPFDAIIVTAAAEFVPPPLIDQLKEDGRMIIPVGNPFSTQQLLEVTKDKGEVRSRNLMFVRFVPFTRSKEEE